ncbi:hypothetical protein PsAD13_01060 [Pseudovibrio sp. Ad13]|nr:hypothetical protein PsAD13_01060 [Pseudovibrio sp. Ad13]
MGRRRHAKKEVEAVLCELEELGWTVRLRNGKGHAWGLLLCPFNDEQCRCGEFCQMSISSTPQNPSTHAAKLKKKALSCIYLNQKETEDVEPV